MRPGALALATLEVAVRRGRDAVAGDRHIAVHPDAHRTAGVAPLEARVDEDSIESLRLGRALDQPRARHDPRGYDRAAPLHDPRRCAQVVEATVRARADEHA